LLWFEEITPILDVNDFVQGLLMTGSGIVVYGPSNCGKTFWATDLALHIAAGINWNGRRVTQGGVLYCVLEGGVGFRNRVAAWKEEHGVGDDNLPFAVVPSQLNLLQPEADTAPLIAAIRLASEQMGQPVVLVIIDTLARAMAGGNENAPDDMGRLVMNMDRIRAETGAAVMFVHHTGKDQSRGARGHSSLQAAIDTEIEVFHEADGDLRIARVVKQREFRRGDVFRFKLCIVELGHNRHGELVSSCVVEAADEQSDGTDLASRGLVGHSKLALDILKRLLEAEGQEGHPGVPHGISSVPESLWRRQFYNGVTPATKGQTKRKSAEGDAKRRAFHRAASALITRKIVRVGSGQVWLCESEGNVFLEVRDIETFTTPPNSGQLGHSL